MATTDDFWGRMKGGAGGMFDLGAGLYGRSAGAKEASSRLRASQGPLYDTQMAGANQALNVAGGMDPRALGQERYDATQGLLAGSDAKNEADLMRMLQAKGMLGAATFNPGVEGITPNGTAMNPKLAAYYAAKNARDAKMAAGALDQGDAMLDRQINRAGALQGQAANTQRAGMVAQDSQPSKSAATMQLLKGIGGVAKDTGLFGMGADWLKRTFGGGGYADPFTSMSVDSIDW
jgi:hypothetical protein